MNIREIVPGTNGSVIRYLQLAVPLTIVTVWVIVALQSEHFLGCNLSTSRRILWPFVLARRAFQDDDLVCQKNVKRSSAEVESFTNDGSSAKDNL
jgi:hypothetical protein